MGEIAVVGAGPAGRAITHELAKRNASVVLHGPDEWPNTYGFWVDETDYRDIFEAVWSHPIFATDSGIVELDRMYGRVDPEKLKLRLDPLKARRSLDEVKLEDIVDVDVVVDCTGFNPLLVSRPQADVGFQTAYGIIADVDGEPIDGHDAALMDFRTFDDWDGPATFLYAMRLPDGRWFLEETVLVARPAVPIKALRERLYARMASRNVTILKTYEEERCVIPMGDHIPDPQKVIGFGAAASYVHPATGYSVARSLNAAPAVAGAILANLDNPETAWDAVWPAERRATRELYQFGLESLLGMTQDQTHRFFDAFFELPEDKWRGYLGATLTVSEVATTMMRVFSSVGFDLKAELAKSIMADGQLGRLRRAFLG